jgi:hypothetical protein
VNNDAFVNQTCGLHVHFDMTNETAESRENIVKWWCVLEPIIFSTVPYHRYTSTYCKPNAGSTTQHIQRYHALNLTALNKFDTYEVRVHQGTLDADIIKSWIAFLLSFMDTFSQINPTDYRLRAVRAMSMRAKLIFLFQQTKLSLTLRKMLIKRVRAYGDMSIYDNCAA